MRKLIGLMVVLTVGAVVWAASDLDLGAPIHVPKVTTPVLEVVGHNNRILVNGGYVLITNGNLYVDGTAYIDVQVISTLSNVTLAVSGDATVGGALTVTGKTTANGELEANDIVDINSSDTNDIITIDQTNTVGKSGVPYIQIKDARTGANANQTNEATVVISSEGTYALAVTKGAVDCAGTVSATTLQGSLASTYIAGGLCASMPVSATYSTVTNAQITFQAKDPAGSNLSRATGFEFWFSTAAVVTLPSTNSIQSFSVQNGDMRMYREANSAVPTYIAQTDNAGLFRFNTVGITNDTGLLTNYVHLLGPNGYYTNYQMVWTP